MTKPYPQLAADCDSVMRPIAQKGPEPRSAYVGLRLPTALACSILAVAEREGVSRQDVILTILEQHFKER